VWVLAGVLACAKPPAPVTPEPEAPRSPVATPVAAPSPEAATLAIMRELEAADAQVAAALAAVALDPKAKPKLDAARRERVAIELRLPTSTADAIQKDLDALARLIPDDKSIGRASDVGALRGELAGLVARHAALVQRSKLAAAALDEAWRFTERDQQKRVTEIIEGLARADRDLHEIGTGLGLVEAALRDEEMQRERDAARAKLEQLRKERDELERQIRSGKKQP
jgi:hypothetical protein